MMAFESLKLHMGFIKCCKPVPIVFVCEVFLQKITIHDYEVFSVQRCHSQQKYTKIHILWFELLNPVTQ